MRSEWKSTLTLLFCLLCFALCAGCGGDKTDTADIAAVTPTEESTEEPVTPEEETAEPQEPAAVQTPEETAEKLPIDQPLEMTFASGAGAWSTDLTLSPDGTFSGEHHDSDMGDSGEGYPYGTFYTCAFEGKFTDIRQVDDHTYAMTLEYLNILGDREEGEEWIEDDVRYIASYPYGMDDGTEFLLLTPETPLEGLDEDFLSWWPGRYDQSDDTEKCNTLNCYGLWNQATNYGFFTYD